MAGLVEEGAADDFTDDAAAVEGAADDPVAEVVPLLAHAETSRATPTRATPRARVAGTVEGETTPRG
jgi:hypothetical protein